ncbi:hypothetical protein Y032_0355g3327 [Ancylostoma ceylanicum]|uniref:Uncharacterized protein n=1 Tax=Ancylostoma ceylanicum TaxID=53326 RepID=A0A016RX14_9BILA|nr:hypothetical protein Y032_0355g3327 [Ancylostoma ceylanicum]
MFQLNDYTKSKGVVYDKRMVNEAVRNVGGNFAVLYTVQNADCGEVLISIKFSLLQTLTEAYIEKVLKASVHIMPMLILLLGERLCTRSEARGGLYHSHESQMRRQASIHNQMIDIRSAQVEKVVKRI